METKTYDIQGQSFKMIGDGLGLLNKGMKLIARYRTLTQEYTGALDFSIAKKYTDPIDALTIDKVGRETVLKQGTEDGIPLTDEKKTEIQNLIDGYQKQIDEINEQYDSDVELQSLLKLKDELSGYALLELLTDTAFIKPILKKILKGGNIDKVDFTQDEALIFVKDAVSDFFTLSGNSTKKL